MISIGNQAGYSRQSSNAISIGTYAAALSQNAYSISIGDFAGYSYQNAFAIAIGQNAGITNQNSNTVAIGTKAGQSNQGLNAVAIGPSAGTTSQSASAIAIGYQAGSSSQGSGTIAIGVNAGNSSLIGNCIVISAIGSGLSPTSNAGLYVAPIRFPNVANYGNVLAYNQTTKEIYDSGMSTLPGTVIPIIATNGINFSSNTTGFYSNTMTNNITSLSLSNPAIGGQYTVFLNGQSSGSVYYVSNALGASIRSNWAGNLNIPLNSTGQMLITYTGSNYLVSLGTYS